MKGFTTLCLLALFGVCCSQKLGFGGCPRPSVKQNFEKDRYYGVWYEALRYPLVIFEIGLKCVTATYSEIDENTIRVLNQGVSTSRWTFGDDGDDAEGRATIVDPDEPAKLRVTFSEGSSFFDSDDANYWVVDTDYENFSIVYSCTDLGWFHADILWVLSRTPELDATLKRDTKQKIRDEGLRAGALEEMDQSCHIDQD